MAPDPPAPQTPRAGVPGAQGPAGQGPGSPWALRGLKGKGLETPGPWGPSGGPQWAPSSFPSRPASGPLRVPRNCVNPLGVPGKPGVLGTHRTPWGTPGPGPRPGGHLEPPGNWGSRGAQGPAGPGPGSPWALRGVKGKGSETPGPWGPSGDPQWAPGPFPSHPSVGTSEGPPELYEPTGSSGEAGGPGDSKDPLGDSWAGA